MKTFSVAFTRLKCSEILSIVYKKNGEPFFESLTFASAMIYQNEVRTKHLRMLIFYSAIDNPSSLRRTIILFRYSAFIENERQCFVKKNYSSFNFVTQ